MAPLEPLAGTAELAPEPESLRQNALSSSITSLRSAGALSASASTSARANGGIHALTARLGLGGVARRTLGITLLLVTVCLWTVSNFLASYIFSDHTYDKPFFVVYINTSVFALSLVPMFARYVMRHGLTGVRAEARALLRGHHQGRGRDGGSAEDDGKTAARLRGVRVEGAAGSSSLFGRPASKVPDEEAHGLLSGRDEDEDEDEEHSDMAPEEGEAESSTHSTFELVEPVGSGSGGVGDKLSLRETAALSLEFCMLWFCANYFASACLEYTSVGSVTILTSTSSVWTLVFCAVMRVETFSMRKLVGVLASLAGVVLISTVDLSGQSDEDRGNFPHKSQASIAIGDGMAFFSAIVYGLYVTVMKRRVGDEDRVNMQLFFGLVGLFNLALLWPGFFLLHWTGIEPFAWPPSGKVWLIIIVGAMSIPSCWFTLFTDAWYSSTPSRPSSATCHGPTPCSSPRRWSSPSACR